MKLLKDSLTLFKLLATGSASREVYFLFVIAKLAAFTVGVIVGACLL